MNCPSGGWELEIGRWRMLRALSSCRPVCASSSLWSQPSAWLVLWLSHFLSTGSACSCHFFLLHLCCAYYTSVRGLAVSHFTPARQPAIRLPSQIFTLGQGTQGLLAWHRPWGTQLTTSGHLPFYCTTINSNFKVDLFQLFRVPTCTISSLLTWDALLLLTLIYCSLCLFSTLMFSSYF